MGGMGVMGSMTYRTAKQETAAEASLADMNSVMVAIRHFLPFLPLFSLFL